MVYVFIILAVISFLGFFLQSLRRDGHGMAYAAVIFCVWVAAAVWWAGKLG